nr:retrotransposable element Tf2 [Tanacetum cinerariifolium]
QRASGLLQQLDIPVWKWDEISMDFVTRLPRTQRKHDAICVVVDRLTKSAHFLPIRKDYFVSRLAEIFQQEIVRLHGTPSAIVSDRDPRFASRFWKGLQNAWGTRLKFSTAFHPQTDGQIEFAYNNSWHASIKCAPFEMLYGRKCRAPICWDQILDRVGKVSYRLALPPQLSHVHNVIHVSLLRGYKYHPLHVISYPLDQIRTDLSYVEEPEAILDRQDRVMRKKTIPFIKIL